MKKYKYEEYIYNEVNFKDRIVEKELVNLLKEKKFSISTAESITGGLIASKIVNIPGASDIFEEGYITYSDRAKRKILNVGKDALLEYSAVSKEVCFEMINNLKQITNTDTAITITGYAGPDGEVGLAYIGINNEDKYIIKKLKIKGRRNEIRNIMSNIAIDSLIEEIEG